MTGQRQVPCTFLTTQTLFLNPELTVLVGLAGQPTPEISQCVSHLVLGLQTQIAALGSYVDAADPRICPHAYLHGIHFTYQAFFSVPVGVIFLLKVHTTKN